MSASLIHEAASEMHEKLAGWRRQLHRLPELGLDCKRTSDLAAGVLENLGYTVNRGFARTGMVATLGKGSPVVALRVDMDALPLQEETGLPFASEIDGVMHACGHDGHTAIGLGVACIMARFIEGRTGTVMLIFQPGEEYPGGASLMIEEGALAENKPDLIMAMHLFPDLPAGKIGLRYGVMTASNDEFTINLGGRGGHGAYPHRCIDPFPAAAALINAVQTIVSRNIDPLDPIVVTLAEIRGGVGHNVIPEKICLKGTVRCLTEETRRLAGQRLQEILDGLSAMYNVHAGLELVEGEPVMACDGAETRFAETVLQSQFGEAQVVRIDRPSLGVDDFAFFTRVSPAVYLRLGCHDAARGYVNPLHNSRFDFDESLLVLGVEAAVTVLVNKLQRGRTGNPHRLS